MHMGVTVSVISGKGGTGKTTLCAGIAACLAAEGKRVLCIDADIGLRNLDIALGMAEQPAVAFTDVTQGFCKLSDAAEHPALPGLFLLTAPVREQDALVEQQRFGAIYLGIIAVLPVLLGTIMSNTRFSFGGTSIIIVVSVALETVAAIEAQMLMRNYSGFLEK